MSKALTQVDLAINREKKIKPFSGTTITETKRILTEIGYAEKSMTDVLRTVNVEAQLSAKRALIVDDDPIFRFSSALALEMDDFEVWEAANGKYALDLIEAERKRKRDFDLFVVDLIMPVMDGMQLIREIQKVNLTDRVLVVSGSINAQAKKELRSFGCHHWLAKPFLVSQLVDAVRQIQGPGV